MYAVTSESDAETLFGTESAPTLTPLVKFLLRQGVNPVYTVASVKHDTTVSTTAQRKTAWATFDESDRIRLRLTDSDQNSVHVELKNHLGYADDLFNKQIGFVGETDGTSKTTLIASALAIDSSRVILVGPGIYKDGELLSGTFATAAVAAEFAKNPDISDDLDRLTIPNVGGIELTTTMLPLFRKTNTAGTVTNDFEDLLQAGVSPIGLYNGNAIITHVTTTYQADGSYDSIQTRLIIDQVFVDVRDYLDDNSYLRRGNTEQVRGRLTGAIEGLLEERQAWITPVEQLDGEFGYNVQVVSSADNRQLTISYEGEVVRGISTIRVNANLIIAT